MYQESQRIFKNLKVLFESCCVSVEVIACVSVRAGQKWKMLGSVIPVPTVSYAIKDIYC